MGLDNYWVGQKREDGEWDTARIGHNFPEIIGGMFSGSGDHSFRGKAYADLVKKVTGESLYTDYISPEKVREMADQLQAVTIVEWLESDGEVSLEKLSTEERLAQIKHMEAFKAMWKEHAEAGHGLVSWY